MPNPGRRPGFFEKFTSGRGQPGDPVFKDPRRQVGVYISTTAIPEGARCLGPNGAEIVSTVGDVARAFGVTVEKEATGPSGANQY